MTLRYFNTTDDDETLKRKRKTLAKKYHPDIYGEQGTKIMQDVNNEYDYCIQHKHSKPSENLADFLNNVMADLKNRKPGMKTFEETLFEAIVSMFNVSAKKKSTRK